MEGPPSDAREQPPQQAAMVLHDTDLSPLEIVARLEALVVGLGLATSATFVPASAGTPEVGADSLAVPITRPGSATGRGLLAGWLCCAGADPGDRQKLTMLGAHAGVALGALARVREVEAREEQVRRVAEHLQDSLLPVLPEVRGASVAVQYRAAAREARVGGDFYDVFTLPDGRVFIAVGDVMGKGVEAAGRTSMITQTLRALVLQGLPLDVLLARADEQVSYQDPDIMATVWCGFYEPSTGELAFASLGHPPALLMRADGEPLHLTMEGLPLGLRNLTDEPPECRDRQLQPRDLLVLYTDGVVEASRDYLAGQEALLAAIEARRGEPLNEMVQNALDELLHDAGHTDDAVMLLLRRR
jgi:serine phosphatase RsbU (regulator of sigma subunit)